MGSFLGSKGQTENTGAAVRQTIDQAQNAMSNLASDTEALKTNFFLRGFFNRRGFYNLTTITPSKYAHSRFVKEPNERVWIPAAELFKDDPKDAPELSKASQTALDKSMSKLVPYLPNNPIVIEGYSTDGSPDQQSGVAPACPRCSPVFAETLSPRLNGRRHYATGRPPTRGSRQAELGRGMPGPGCL